ncbi:MAG: hypothetical protein E7652_02930 [Ruminococcaceae bacterium]|nr:hypothetical protein [Oscillospiraceae bacterium]
MEQTKYNSISKKYKYCIVFCCAIVMLLCMGHITGNTVVLAGCFVFFAIIALYAVLNGLSVPVLLFFLPWSPLMKFAPGQTSLYTIAFFAVCLLAFINNYNRLRLNYVAFVVLLFVSTGISKFINGYYIDKSYILFFIFLFMFPALLFELDGKYDYYVLTIIFSLGIITAAFASKQFANYGSIAKFIDVYVWEQMGITRYSGFYGDSNFYSAHITVALSGIMLMLLKRLTQKRFIVLIITAVLLLYSGLLSASKTFTLIAIIMALFWVALVLFLKNKVSYKLLLISALLIAVGVVLYSGVFADVLDVIVRRFNQGNDAQTLTTGRTKLWKSYFSVLMNDFKVLFIGQGFTNINVAGRASHNTLIQSVYQFGIVGLVFFIFWIISVFSLNSKQINLKRVNPIMMGILVLGCFGLWLSLDLLFFDELFLIMYYFVFSLKWCEETSGKIFKSNEKKGETE